MRALVSDGAGSRAARSWPSDTCRVRRRDRCCCGCARRRSRCATSRWRTGAYGDGSRGTLVLGGEGVGVVVECGAGVTAWRLGQRVNPLFVQGWTEEACASRGRRDDDARRAARCDGTLAEYILASAGSLVEVPAHLSDAEAATLPFAGLTAWRAVREQAGIAGRRHGRRAGDEWHPAVRASVRASGAGTVIVTLEERRQAGARDGDRCGHTINYQSDARMVARGARSHRRSRRRPRPRPRRHGDDGAIAACAASRRHGQRVQCARWAGWQPRHRRLAALAAWATTCACRAATRGRFRRTGRWPMRLPGRACARSSNASSPLSGAADAIAAAPKSEQFGKVCVQISRAAEMDFDDTPDEAAFRAEARAWLAANAAPRDGARLAARQPGDRRLQRRVSARRATGRRASSTAASARSTLPKRSVGAAARRCRT